MATKIEYREIPDGSLLIRSIQHFSWVRGIFSAISILGCIFIIAWHHVSLPLLCLVLASCGSITVFWAARGSVSEFYVTSLEIRTHRQVWLQTIAENILCSDIRRIEYQVGDEGEPNGLYAQLHWNSVCLLPNINEEQALSVKDKIYAHFPDIPIGLFETNEPLLFRDATIRLDLNKRS